MAVRIFDKVLFVKLKKGLYTNSIYTNINSQLMDQFGPKPVVLCI